MNISAQTLVFSNLCWYHLQCLSIEKRTSLLKNITAIINQSNCQNKLKQLDLNNNSSMLIKIPCNQNQQILVTIINLSSTQKALKIINFVEKIESSNYLESTEFIDNLQVETFPEIATDLDIDTQLIADNFINQTNQITIKDFELQHNDFYYFLGNNNSNYKLQILLSPEQAQIIKRKPNLPILLTGNQGTGKTTTAVYQALINAQIQQQNEQYHILYVTPNQRLNQQIYQVINKFTKDIIKNLRCQEYQSVCRFIGQKYGIIANNQFLAQRKITFHKFFEQFYEPKKIFSIKAEELWLEIYQNIKGLSKSINNQSGLISLEDYLEFKKQNNNNLLAENNLKLIHNLANQYQKWLRSQNYWDELDLTQFLLSHMTEHYQGDYDEIYLDEIQTLTEIQIQLLLKLLKVKKEKNCLPKFCLIATTESSLQKNNFNWNKIKKIIVELYHKLPQWEEIRALIEPISFNHQFNRPENITNLSQAIVNLSQASSSLNKNQKQQFSWVNSNNKTLIISGEESEILTHQTHLAIDGAIIVFNDEDKQKLSQYFVNDNQRILTIKETDGVEFNQVLIWKLFTYLNWQQNQPEINLTEFKKLKYDYLYLCINLAKEKLYFYDQEINEFWNFPTVNELIEIGYSTELNNIFTQINDPEKIINQAEIYLQLGVEKAYEIARQLYHQADDITGIAKVEAIKEEEQGNWGKAGDIWNELKIFDSAIRCWNEVDQRLWLAKWAVLKVDDWSQRGLYFEEKRDYNLANLCYEKADDFAGKLRCLEATNQWELAGDKCQAVNQIQQAEKYYQLADKYYQETKQPKLAIQMWTKLAKWDQVALIWEKVKQWEKAAFCWQKQGEKEKAGICWQKAEKWIEAEKCWRELNDWVKLAQCYEIEGKWQLAADTWLKQGEKEKAGFCYQKGNQWAEAEIIWRELDYWGLVAICLQQQEKWQESAQAWEKANPFEQQALCYEKIGEWDKAEKCWLKAKNWVRSILAVEKQGKWQEAAESWENLAEWEKSAKAWLQIAEFEKAGECYEIGEYWQLAEQCWRQLNFDSRLANNLVKQRKYKESAQIWENLAEWQKAGEAWYQEGDKEKAGECYEKGEYWREAEECWREIANWERVDLTCEKQGKWQKAAHDWLMKNQLDKAALCYENCQDWERAAKYWKLSHNWGKYADACEQLQKWEEAGEAYLRVDSNENTEKAGICFEKAQNWDKAADCWQKIWKWEKLALIRQQQQQWNEAGKAWLLMNEAEKAVECYEKVKNWEKVEECYRKLENWSKLALVCQYQGKWEDAAQLWNFLEEWEKAGDACVQMEDIETAIKYYEKGELWQKAEQYRQK